MSRIMKPGCYTYVIPFPTRFARINAITVAAARKSVWRNYGMHPSLPLYPFRRQSASLNVYARDAPILLLGIRAVLASSVKLAHGHARAASFHIGWVAGTNPPNRATEIAMQQRETAITLRVVSVCMRL